jgi:benzoate membrane transport protein
MRLVGPEPVSGAGGNLRDLPRYTTISTVSAGFIATLSSIAGPSLLVYQAAVNAEYPAAAINSWFLAIFVGGGLLSILLAILYREPICGAYSIAGSALLVPVLGQYSLSEAVGAFLLSGLLVTLAGISGLFGWIMDHIPNEIIMGMLAGILFRFGLGIFTPLPEEPLMVGAMILIYIIGSRFIYGFTPVMLALLAGAIIAGLSGQLRLDSVHLSLSQPVLVSPEFRLDAFLSLSLPLTLLAIASQNAPGVGILRANGYRAPVNAIMILSGIGSILTAPFLGHGVNIAAPMTAICASPEAHPNPQGRYAASAIQGACFIAFGLVGATAISLIQAFPTALVAVVAGLALLPAILQAFQLSVVQSRHAFGAAFALLIGASGISILGINSAFWAIVVGVIAGRLLEQRPVAR